MTHIHCGCGNITIHSGGKVDAPPTTGPLNLVQCIKLSIAGVSIKKKALVTTSACEDFKVFATHPDYPNIAFIDPVLPEQRSPVSPHSILEPEVQRESEESESVTMGFEMDSCPIRTPEPTSIPSHLEDTASSAFGVRLPSYVFTPPNLPSPSQDTIRQASEESNELCKEAIHIEQARSEERIKQFLQKEKNDLALFSKEISARSKVYNGILSLALQAAKDNSSILLPKETSTIEESTEERLPSRPTTPTKAIHLSKHIEAPDSPHPEKHLASSTQDSSNREILLPGRALNFDTSVPPERKKSGGFGMPPISGASIKANAPSDKVNNPKDSNKSIPKRASSGEFTMGDFEDLDEDSTTAAVDDMEWSDDDDAVQVTSSTQIPDMMGRSLPIHMVHAVPSTTGLTRNQQRTFSMKSREHLHEKEAAPDMSFQSLKNKFQPNPVVEDPFEVPLSSSYMPPSALLKSRNLASTLL